MKKTPVICLLAAALTGGALGCDRSEPKASAEEPSSASQPLEESQAALVRADESDRLADGADNHAPSISNLTFHPSKFVKCGETIKACVTARDPDGDELKTAWQVTAGEEPEGGFEQASTLRKKHRLHECVRFTPAKGETTIEVRIIDQRAVPTRPGGQPEEVNLYDSLSFPVRAGGDKC